MGVTRCWSPAWSRDSLSHGIDKMADPVMLSIFGVQLLMFVQVVVTFMHVRQVSVLPPGIVVRKLQRSHSEISRIEPLSGLSRRLFFGLPIRFTYPVYLSGLPIRFSVFRETLSDLTLDQSKVRSDKLLCVNTALEVHKVVYYG